MTTAQNLYMNALTCYNVYAERYSLTNPLFHLSNDKKTMSWYNYKPKEHFYTYEEYYQWANDNLQYSIAISNKALIQLFYYEKDSNITKASLSFLPNPDELMSYFRFDLDCENHEDYHHNSSHINFGYRADNIRYSLNKFPYPSEFIKFCLFVAGNHELTNFNGRKFLADLDTRGELYCHLFDFDCK